jgi:3-dehydroquinate dehydratase / shikimate dehydrogenase
MLFLSIARLVDCNGPAAIELRLDLFQELDFERIENFLSRGPALLTLRSISHGGQFSGSESERETRIQRLLTLEPSYFDLEWDMRPAFLRETITKNSKTQFILSYHNFQQTPSDLNAIYQAMQTYPAFSYKIAAMAHSVNDALKMLLFAKKHARVSVICMGKKGEFARVLGPVVGNLVDYAAFDDQTGPGQLSAQEFHDVYHYPRLNEHTGIYGLIGDPVENSPGHLYHNAVFRKRQLNAVYVKMAVAPQELPDFMALAKELGIRGLSVTMPLKEAIVPFVDDLDESARRIGAVNTLLFEKGIVRGTNTDGKGALDAIEKKSAVQGKKMVLLGAGGAARSIAFEGQARGADVWVLNRTVERAQKIAMDRGVSLDEVPERYDILINCTPDPMPIDPKKILPGTVVMDIVHSPRETAFLKEACLKQCSIVYGEEMFLNQAARQTAFWMGS